MLCLKAQNKPILNPFKMFVYAGGFPAFNSHATCSENINFKNTNLMFDIYLTLNSFPDLEFACHPRHLR